MASDAVLKTLTAEQVLELTQAFLAFDENKNGYITTKEMDQCLRRTNIPHQNAEVNQVISAMDYDKDGDVSYEEYMKYMAASVAAEAKQRK